MFDEDSNCAGIYGPDRTTYAATTWLHPQPVGGLRRFGAPRGTPIPHTVESAYRTLALDDRKATILVVDDEESIRDIVSRRLEEEGYTCVTAADGKEALWKSFMQDFDLVLSDIKMPGMSGMEVLSQMINDHPDTGVVMITAISETQTAVEAMKIGAYDFVTKPFNLEDLLMRVQRALERRRLVLENREYQLHLQQKVERQVGQIQQYYREAIEALSREESMLKELNARTSDRNCDAGGKVGSQESGFASSMLKAFSMKMSGLIGSADSTDAVNTDDNQGPDEAASQQPSQAAAGDEESEPDESHVLYQGLVEIAIAAPVDLRRMVDLYEHMNNTPGVDVINLGGSARRGITIRLLLENPVHLMRILQAQPEVKKASDQNVSAGESMATQAGELRPIRRIALELVQD